MAQRNDVNDQNEHPTKCQIKQMSIENKNLNGRIKWKSTRIKYIQSKLLPLYWFVWLDFYQFCFIAHLHNVFPFKKKGDEKRDEQRANKKTETEQIQS